MFSIPLQMMLVAVAGWVNREQLAIIDYLKEENRVVCHLSAEPQMLASQRDQCVAIRPT